MNIVYFGLVSNVTVTANILLSQEYHLAWITCTASVSVNAWFRSRAVLWRRGRLILLYRSLCVSLIRTGLSCQEIELY